MANIIVFLDIDGVLNNKNFFKRKPTKRWRGGMDSDQLMKHFDMQNVKDFKKYIDSLRKIDNTVKIVISSSWRLHFSQQFLYDLFDVFLGIKIEKVNENLLLGSKGEFVHNYLATQQQDVIAVIIDDNLGKYENIDLGGTTTQTNKIIPFTINNMIGFRHHAYNPDYDYYQKQLNEMTNECNYNEKRNK